MPIFVRRSFAAAAVCLWLVACTSPASREAAQPSQPQTQVQRYDLKGTVIGVDKEGKKLTVDHEDIEGLMNAMTMSYAVKDARLLENLAAGQAITAKVVVGENDYWLEEIAVTPAAPAK